MKGTEARNSNSPSHVGKKKGASCLASDCARGSNHHDGGGFERRPCWRGGYNIEGGLPASWNGTAHRSAFKLAPKHSRIHAIRKCTASAHHLSHTMQTKQVSVIWATLPRFQLWNDLISTSIKWSVSSHPPTYHTSSDGYAPWSPWIWFHKWIFCPLSAKDGLLNITSLLSVACTCLFIGSQCISWWTNKSNEQYTVLICKYVCTFISSA